MLIIPAIDLYEGKAVRLLKGDYRQMTVYDPDSGSEYAVTMEDGRLVIRLVESSASSSSL